MRRTAVGGQGVGGYVADPDRAGAFPADTESRPPRGAPEPRTALPVLCGLSEGGDQFPSCGEPYPVRHQENQASVLGFLRNRMYRVL